MNSEWNKILINENLRIHSFDAYYKNIRLINNNMIIPYINLGFSNDYINESSVMKYLKKTYLVAENVDYLSVYKEGAIINPENGNGFNYFFGGYNLSNDKFIDIELKSDKIYLIVPSKFHLTENFWVPINTPNLNANLDQKESALFFDYSDFPNEFKYLFG